MKITLDAQTLDLNPSGRGYNASLGDRLVPVEVIRAGDGELRLVVDGRPVRALISAEGARRWVTIGGQTWLLTKSAGPGAACHAGHASGELLSPMPGQVRAVQVTIGQSVTKGQTLLVVEAMKMEIRVVAPRDGLVKSLKVKQGQTVERDQLLVEIVEAPG
jgi:3-methylcrotonyl-CoA carboxylase alpha subunit